MCKIAVAPLVGAWIEIVILRRKGGVSKVAPLVGAWIEIDVAIRAVHQTQSLPLWERGLKSFLTMDGEVIFGRSPCGSVD